MIFYCVTVAFFYLSKASPIQVRGAHLGKEVYIRSHVELHRKLLPEYLLIYNEGVYVCEIRIEQSKAPPSPLLPPVTYPQETEENRVI